MNAINVIKRSISTSSQLNGKKNFRKFLLYNKRGPRVFKEQQRIEPHPACPIDKRGVKDTGRKINGVFQDIPEMIPQLIVPNLTGCTLKPYVSYKTPDVIQSEFTCDDLFNAVYGKKIVEDFKNGKLKEDGSPAEPSEEELLNAETAFLRARQTGTDIFFGKINDPLASSEESAKSTG
ncbi:39S ribosomal protein L41, mitochondrial [Bradysia coprophila]|uniref:39S ribosomal protein L41, mitochondrial n=1 Tax=Bradysia coprophila TaxID=38358 RepID=UPI00187DD5D9|nr:39S ribosomal protein L41, mitochondrial [Bradysia coprophila]